MPLIVRIGDTGDLRRLVKQLREVENGKQLRKDLTRGLRRVLQPIARKVRAAYRANPSKQRNRRGGLRDTVARATRVQVSTRGKEIGARILVDGRRMPSGMKAIPLYYEGEKRPWRAPLFGDRDRWYSHQAVPTFYRTVEPHEDDAAREVSRVLETIRRKLEAQ